MNNHPLLSVVIPTKNRQKYCLSAVESILSLPNSNIQLVVQDNSDDLNLSTMLEKFKADQRLIYRYTPPPFTSVENCNAAIELATGEYICLIGDDDGISSQILIATQWAKDNDIDALAGNINLNYRWNDTGAPDTFFTKMTGSTLSILGFNGKAKIVDVNDSLNKLVENGCTNYLDFPFPKIYHGIVKKSVLDVIKNETGEYLKGLSPDIYSSVTLACRINKLVVIDYPFSIPGVCSQSTSISEGQRKDHSKRLEDAPHFRDRKGYKWSEQVPQIYCVQTIWADSCFAALREMGRTDLIDKFDKYNLYAKILHADSTLSGLLQDRIIKDKLDHDFDDSKLKMALLKVKLKDYSKRGLRRLAIILKIKELKHVTGLANMLVTMNYLTLLLQTKNIDVIQNLNKAIRK